MFDLVPFRRNNNLRGRGDNFESFMDAFMNDNFMMPFDFNGGSFRVDMKENENEYIVEADLPGIKKDAIDIDYNNNYLTISAKRDDSVEEKGDSFVRRERHYGEFRRSFYADNVDESKIDAEFKDGVLKIQLPKLEKGKENRRKINIR